MPTDVMPTVTLRSDGRIEDLFVLNCQGSRKFHDFDSVPNVAFMSIHYMFSALIYCE